MSGMHLGSFSLSCVGAALLSIVALSPAHCSSKLSPQKQAELAATKNGLAGATRPWHVLAKFETFDKDGKHSQQRNL